MRCKSHRPCRILAPTLPSHTLHRHPSLVVQVNKCREWTSPCKYKLKLHLLHLEHTTLGVWSTLHLEFGANCTWSLEHTALGVWSTLHLEFGAHCTCFTRSLEHTHLAVLKARIVHRPVADFQSARPYSPSRRRCHRHGCKLCVIMPSG
jgi:hypothetical protein